MTFASYHPRDCPENSNSNSHFLKCKSGMKDHKWTNYRKIESNTIQWQNSVTFCKKIQNIK